MKWWDQMPWQTASKQEKEYIMAVCCHPAYLTFMQSTSWEIFMQVRKQQLEPDMEQQTDSK